MSATRDRPAEFSTELPTLVKGYKRFIATDLEVGAQTSQSKRPLLYEMFELTGHSVLIGDHKSALGRRLRRHTNPPAQVGQSAQEGGMTHTPKHCYANTFQPNMWVVLALDMCPRDSLGMYLEMHS
ncbi:hypothetical protein H257_05202 [Aphanomyces astaci]|uniref:Uncharacterized protein n=1 Tax=Aphanomyces astaci TaxID=112090 RepID=W4GSG0_APHAT|nr:hypothetical protein H257_05202 [Aphanomyces astaci]ETV82622.1 hypothetical protein H257_05202 [Aphanomyces astaci]|eukprot:XP_009828291.1 hypothetical protein H257_05202 [Aphanomyces astaci]